MMENDAIYRRNEPELPDDEVKAASFLSKLENPEQDFARDELEPLKFDEEADLQSRVKHADGDELIDRLDEIVDEKGRDFGRAAVDPKKAAKAANMDLKGEKKALKEKQPEPKKVHFGEKRFKEFAKTNPVTELDDTSENKTGLFKYADKTKTAVELKVAKYNFHEEAPQKADGAPKPKTVTRGKYTFSEEAPLEADGTSAPQTVTHGKYTFRQNAPQNNGGAELLAERDATVRDATVRDWKRRSDELGMGHRKK